MASTPGSSEKIILEINFDDNTVTMIPQSGGVYIYDLDEAGIYGLIERLEAAGAQTTVYTQTVELSEEEYYRMREYYGA